jgi:hypothetical protein
MWPISNAYILPLNVIFLIILAHRDSAAFFVAAEASSTPSQPRERPQSSQILSIHACQAGIGFPDLVCRDAAESWRMGILGILSPKDRNPAGLQHANNACLRRTCNNNNYSASFD